MSNFIVYTWSVWSYKVVILHFLATVCKQKWSFSCECNIMISTFNCAGRWELYNGFMNKTYGYKNRYNLY